MMFSAAHVVTIVYPHIPISNIIPQLIGDFLSVENYRQIMKEKRGRIMGPVDYLVVRFPGNKFSGKILPELDDLESRGIIRVMDFVFVLKDANGELSITEGKDLKAESGTAYEPLANTNEWFYEGDIDAIAASLQNNSSAAILLVENIWAIRFKMALLDADAELIDMGRIPPETIAEAEKAMMTQGGT